MSKSLNEQPHSNLYNYKQRKHGDAKGGPYLAVHLRRRDFLYAHKEDVPSLKETAAQIEKALKENKLKTVFIATDAPTEGMTDTFLAIRLFFEFCKSISFIIHKRLSFYDHL